MSVVENLYLFCCGISRNLCCGRELRVSVQGRQIAKWLVVTEQQQTSGFSLHLVRPHRDGSKILKTA